MNYKLVISDTVEVPVKFTVNDAGKTSGFQFHLIAQRLPQEAFKALAEGDADRTVGQFLADHVTGWRGQRLVVDDAGNPADFSPEAFACMLDLVGVAGLAFTAYIEACGARGKEKN
jgi:hypothetical protein